MNRRTFISATGAALTASALGPASAALSTHSTSASNEAFWAKIRADYDRADGVINLEHGYWGQMSNPVLEAFTENTKQVNAQMSYYARRGWYEDMKGVEARIAGYLGCKPSEIALTRNASEALQALIGGYRSLKEDDAVLYADLDYGSVKTDFETLAARRGAEVITIALPEPATYDGIIAAYDQAMDQHPNLKYMVLTHVSNQTGLIVPVREITERARARGVDVIVDAAHSWGQMNFTLDDLGADFAAFNLHKWIGAPLGVGFLYIRESRLGDIDRSISQGPSMEDRIAGRVYTGTMNFATVLTVNDALDYNDMIGWDRKAARVKALRDVWAEPARDIPGVEVLTPTDPQLSAGITSFRLAGKTTREDNQAIVERLLEDHKIFTVVRVAPENGACIRVTPGLENGPEDCEALLNALKILAS